MTEVIREGNAVDFSTFDLYPKSYVSTGQPKNLHILPVNFNGRMYGHVAVGYNDPIVYNFLLKRFISRLAVALEILSIRNSVNIPVEQSAIEPITEAPTHKGKATTAGAASVFVLKDGSQNKVLVENVLYFEAENKKTYAVLKSGRYEIKKSLSVLEDMLMSRNFMRVSKSVLINMDKVVKYVSDSDRTLIVMLYNKY